MFENLISHFYHVSVMQVVCLLFACIIKITKHLVQPIAVNIFLMKRATRMITNERGDCPSENTNTAQRRHISVAVETS